MKARDFCYWLQGFFELRGTTAMSEEQVVAVKNHLALVFKHEIDPSIDGGDQATQAQLGAIHNPGGPSISGGLQPGMLPSGHPPVMRC